MAGVLVDVKWVSIAYNRWEMIRPRFKNLLFVMFLKFSTFPFYSYQESAEQHRGDKRSL